MVEKGSKGFKTNKIRNKLSMRITQNMNIDMKDVFVPDNNRLAKATKFGDGPNLVLMHSRLLIAFMCAGMAAGSVEVAMKYAQKRVAFKKPIGSF